MSTPQTRPELSPEYQAVHDVYTFNDVLGITFTLMTPDRVEATMPITPTIMQNFGIVHGGATLTLLEAVASWGATLRANLEVESPFGVEAHIKHKKSGREGSVRGVAVYNHSERTKQFWDVAAYDDFGDVMSEGTFITKIVSHERLAEKAREQKAARKAQTDA